MPRREKPKLPKWVDAELKGWMTEVLTDAAKKQIKDHLDTVPDRTKEIELQLARTVLAEVAAETLDSLKAESIASLASVRMNMWRCQAETEEAIYERMCNELMTNGVIERIKKLDDTLANISDGFKVYIREQGSRLDNLETAFAQVKLEGDASYKRMLREVHRIDEDIEMLMQRIENSHINS